MNELFFPSYEEKPLSKEEQISRLVGYVCSELDVMRYDLQHKNGAIVRTLLRSVESALDEIDKLKENS